MKKINPFLPIFFPFFFSFVLLAFWPGEAISVYYKYVDRDGNVHFTDQYETIPPEYRKQVETVTEKRDELTPEQLLQEKKKEEAEERRAEEQARKDEAERQKKIAAEEEALKEKEAQEAKIKARQEKEKQIEELSKQIGAKQEQQKNLRLWMVNERRVFFQLQDEIETLSKEIQSIQKELSPGK